MVCAEGSACLIKVSAPTRVQTTWRARAKAAEATLRAMEAKGQEVGEEEWSIVMRAWSQAGDVDAAARVMQAFGPTVGGE